MSQPSLLQQTQQCAFAQQNDPAFAQNVASAYNYNLLKGLIQNPVPAFANGTFVCFQDNDAANGCVDVTKLPPALANNLISCKTVQGQGGPYQACFMSAGPGQTGTQLCQAFNSSQSQ